jgi:flagellar biosynthesis anti-sigma factor FlgM
MRIDLHYGPQSTEHADRSRNSNLDGTASASGNKLQTEDRAQISGAHVQVQALVAEALRSPDSREQRVQSLREAVLNGKFQVDSRQTAGAVMEHMRIAR